MLEEKLGYSFQNEKLLKQALIHKSYITKDGKGINNERMEFLGDSILGFTIAHHLYKNFSDLPEGELSKIRSMVVCEEALYKIAKQISLGEAVLMGKGEELSDGRERPSILSDAMEAVFAAVFLDGGMDKAQEVIIRLLKNEIESAVSGSDIKDYKTMLQEITQKKYIHSPSYVLLKEEGPDHNKKFTASVNLQDKELGRGTGRTKKEAEKNAAKEAIELLENKN